MDRLLSMRAFQAVADEGGFAAAARTLDMAPAGVTRLVADLESHVGVRLMQRTTRRVSLTEAGEAYLARVRQIVADVEEAHALAQSHSAELSGVLRLLTSPSLSVHLLAPLLVAFRQQHPHIDIELQVERQVTTADSDYDITLLGADESYDANVVARRIVQTDTVLCAAPAYAQRRGLPQTPDELAAHDCLLLHRPEGRQGLLRLVQPAPHAQTVEVRVPPVLVANHIETLLHATLEGGGISVQPLLLAAPALRDGRLVHVLPPWTSGRYTIYAAVPSRKYLPARTRAFLDFLSERVRAQVQAAVQEGLCTSGIELP